MKAYKITIKHSSESVHSILRALLKAISFYIKFPMYLVGKWLGSVTSQTVKIESGNLFNRGKENLFEILPSSWRESPHIAEPNFQKTVY